MKKIWYMPGFWMLIAANAFILFYYLEYPESIHTVIALFWVQSVVIGVFNGLDMLTLQNTVENSFTINDKPGNRQGCAGIFFLFHYGFFHFVYIFFLPQIIEFKHLDWNFIRISFWLLIASSVVDFIYSKRRNRTQPVNIGYMMFMPYARIVPIHLLILAPAFSQYQCSNAFYPLKDRCRCDHVCCVPEGCISTTCGKVYFKSVIVVLQEIISIRDQQKMRIQDKFPPKLLFS